CISLFFPGQWSLGCSLPCVFSLFDFLFHFFFHAFDLNTFALDVEAQSAKCAHIDIRDPNHREAGEDISPPVIEQKLVPGKPKNEDGHVMAEAVLTGEQIEELSLKESATALAFAHAKLPRLAKDLLVSDGPGKARNRNRKNEGDAKLHSVIVRKRHIRKKHLRNEMLLRCGGIMLRGNLISCCSITSPTERNLAILKLFAAGA